MFSSATLIKPLEEINTSSPYTRRFILQSILRQGNHNLSLFRLQDRAHPVISCRQKNHVCRRMTTRYPDRVKNIYGHGFQCTVLANSAVLSLPPELLRGLKPAPPAKGCGLLI